MTVYACAYGWIGIAGWQCAQARSRSGVGSLTF